MLTEEAISEFLAPYSSEVRDLAWRVRAAVLAVLPHAVEKVDVPRKLIGYSLGPKMADVVYVIMPLKAAVNLGFSRGAALLDPAGLLEGTGKSARHLKITTAADIENPAVRTLLEAALAAMPS
jgi:hypothetical protein